MQSVIIRGSVNFSYLATENGKNHTGIPGVTIFLDDIKITGRNENEHLERLEKVFNQLQKYNIKINLEKCEFFKKEITHCGYIISSLWIHKNKAKIKAIENIPRPTNINEVRAFIGFVNYYGRFIPKLSIVLNPLYRLLRKDNTYKWTGSF